VTCWEYSYVQLGNDQPERIAQLNEHGAEGWEVVSIANEMVSNGAQKRYANVALLKREIVGTIEVHNATA
jgi:hypothetical protein